MQAVQDYRASFTDVELNAPAVWLDTNREGSKRLDARIAEFQKLPPLEQQQADTLGREARDLDRQAQVEARNNDAAAAAQLRDRSNALAQRVREIRKAHQEKAFFLIQDARAEFDLVNLQPGSKKQAIAFKPDPSFPDFKDPFRPQLVTITFWSKSDPKDNSPRTMWLRKARETFDFPALAALIR